MRKGLIAVAVFTLLLSGEALNALIAFGQEVRHSPIIGLDIRESALAINELLEWLNRYGMRNLSNELGQALTSGNNSRVSEYLNRVEVLLENTPALYVLPAEVFQGLKAAEGLNASITPGDLTALLLMAYKQALKSNQLGVAEAILKILNGGCLSTKDLEKILSFIKALGNTGHYKDSVSSTIDEVLRALSNGTLLNHEEKIEFAAKIAVRHSLFLAEILQAYEPDKQAMISAANNGEGPKIKRATNEVAPEDIVKAMYLLEKLGPKTFFVLKHLPAYKVFMEIIQSNSTAISILKSIPYGSLVDVRKAEKSNLTSKLREEIHYGSNYSTNVKVIEGSNIFKIPPKLLGKFQHLTKEIEKVTNSSYLLQSSYVGKSYRTNLSSSSIAQVSGNGNPVTEQGTYLVIAIASLIALATAWLFLHQTYSNNLESEAARESSRRLLHPFWLVINNYAIKAGVELRPSLTHREAYELIKTSAKKVLSESIIALIKELMMIYEYVTYRGDSKFLYTQRIEEILRRLEISD